MSPKTPEERSAAARASRLKTLFNITPEEYDQIDYYQSGVCAICHQPPKVGGNRLAVDHDHETGLIRGLLCWRCNKLLGYIEEVAKKIGWPIVVVQRIVAYLETPPAVQALGEARYGRPGRVTNKAPKKRKTTRKKK